MSQWLKPYLPPVGCSKNPVRYSRSNSTLIMAKWSWWQKKSPFGIGEKMFRFLSCLRTVDASNRTVAVHHGFLTMIQVRGWIFRCSEAPDIAVPGSSDGTVSLWFIEAEWSARQGQRVLLSCCLGSVTSVQVSICINRSIHNCGLFTSWISLH